MMKKLLFVTAITLPFWCLSDEPKNPKTFEINKHNCNLPMHKIRQLLPKPADQRQATKRCMEKAIKERWKRKNNLIPSQ